MIDIKEIKDMHNYVNQTAASPPNRAPGACAKPFLRTAQVP